MQRDNLSLWCRNIVVGTRAAFPAFLASRAKIRWSSPQSRHCPRISACLRATERDPPLVYAAELSLYLLVYVSKSPGEKWVPDRPVSLSRVYPAGVCGGVRARYLWFAWFIGVDSARKAGSCTCDGCVHHVTSGLVPPWFRRGNLHDATGILWYENAGRNALWLIKK